jgi:tRNA-2-methylthio-N6-dimethylallyladenosine synthase
VDLIIGTKDSDNAAQKIMSLFREPIERASAFKTVGSITRFITIMRGCDNYCSYCIVPFVRGRQTSIDAKIIFDNCLEMVKDGAKEITLLGQNVNSYLYEGLNFSALLKKISEIQDLKRIRFMTNHPKDLSDELIDTIASLPKVCKHIHLPMQSASNAVLEAMNRKYTYGHFLELVEKLRTKIPDISITTDIIVGFPSETQKEFEETLKAVEDIRFDGLYAFRYSPRPQTKASQMQDNVSLEEKKLRHSIILSRSNEISAEIVSKMIGLKQEVLAESFNDGVLHTRTQGGRKVFVNGDIENVGEILPVIIKKAKINALFGEKI